MCNNLISDGIIKFRDQIIDENIIGYQPVSINNGRTVCSAKEKRKTENELTRCQYQSSRIFLSINISLSVFIICKQYGTCKENGVWMQMVSEKTTCDNKEYD